MALNLSDQVFIQIYHLGLYLGAIVLISIATASLLATWLQRLTGTLDGTLSFLFRACTAVALTIFFGPSLYSSLQEILKMILAG